MKRSPQPGPALFHNNLVNNPGRGVIWIKEPYNNLTVRNNHIIARTTVTPRTEGLFGLNGNSDFKTVRISDNIVECIGQTRPLLRGEPSYQAAVLNNRLDNVSDAKRFPAVSNAATVGLERPLTFQCGVHGEQTVNGWEIHPSR